MVRRYPVGHRSECEILTRHFIDEILPGPERKGLTANDYKTVVGYRRLN